MITRALWSTRHRARFAVAITCLFASLAVVPACNTPRPTQDIRDSGNVYYMRGQYPEAAAEYQQIADRYPGDWEAQYKLGLALMKSNQLSGSRRALEIARTRAPANDDVAAALAEVLFQQGDTNRLFAFLRERADQTHSVGAYLRLATYASEAGDPDSAKTALDTAIEVDNGKSVEPYIAAADFEERLGNLDAATRRLRQAYGVNPQHIVVLQRLKEMGEVPGPTLALPPGR